MSNANVSTVSPVALGVGSIEENSLDLPSLINLARNEPLLLLTADGEEFVVAAVDDFEQEVELVSPASG